MALGVLEGRTALITGASRGIGRAIALAFAREGADVAINHHPPADAKFPEAADEVAREVRSLGRRALLIAADVAQEGPVQAMVDRVLEEFGRVDILVNNAGFVTLSRVESMEVALWDDMIATHLRGTFLTTRLVLPGMLARGHGRIINIASQIGQIGRERFAHYAAAKAGIVGFSKSLAREVGPRGVLVNCIAPGPINTGIVPRTPGEPTVDYISPLPLRRVGEPDEVAPTAVFLASDASSYYTGQTLGPNGGDVML
jgi:3-oxoacyl-[acyl-carrier protein] reductase